MFQWFLVYALVIWVVARMLLGGLLDVLLEKSKETRGQCMMLTGASQLFSPGEEPEKQQIKCLKAASQVTLIKHCVRYQM